MNNKKMKLFIVFMCILVVVLLCIIFYLLGAKSNMKSSNLNNVSGANHNKETLDYSDDEESNFDLKLPGEWNDYITTFIFDKDKNKLNANDISNDVKLEFASYIIQDIPYKGEQVKNVLNDYFDNINVILEDFSYCNMCDMNIYKYDKDSDTFDFNPDHPGHGGGVNDMENVVTHFVIMGSKKSGDLIDYTFKMFYTNDKCYMEDICAYGKSYDFVYSSYEDAKNNKNILLTINSDSDYCTYEEPFICDDYKVASKIENELDEYIFTFTVKDDKFKFVSYKKA